MLLVMAAGCSRIVGLIRVRKEDLKTYVEVVQEGTNHLEAICDLRSGEGLIISSKPYPANGSE